MNRIPSFVRLSQGFASRLSLNLPFSRCAGYVLASVLLVSVGLPVMADNYSPSKKYYADYYDNNQNQWVRAYFPSFVDAAQTAWDAYEVPAFWPNTTKVDWFTNQIAPLCQTKEEPDPASHHTGALEARVYTTLSTNGSISCGFTNNYAVVQLWCPYSINQAGPLWAADGTPYCVTPCPCGEVNINGVCTPDISYQKEWQTNADLWVYPEGADGRQCEVEKYPQEGTCPDGKQQGNGPDNTVGNPISCASGIKTQTETDYRSAGPNPLVVQRHYRSDVEDPSLFAAPSYGIMRLTYDPARDIARLDWPDGGIYMFVVSNGAGTSNDADKGTLTQTAGGWDYLTASGRLYQFDADGNLVTQQKPGGQTQTVTYYTSGPGLGKIATVTNAFGLRCHLIMMYRAA